MVRVLESSHDTLAARVLRIFRDELELDVDAQTALLDDGVLDSVAFVRLLAELERAFGLRVEIAELELDDFQTVSRIARLVESRHEVVE